MKQGASQEGEFPHGTVKILMTFQALLPPLIPSSSIFWCWVEPRDSHTLDKCSLPELFWEFSHLTQPDYPSHCFLRLWWWWGDMGKGNSRGQGLSLLLSPC